MNNFSKFETEMNFQIFLHQQEKRWKLHVRESMSALINLCKQTILDVKAICILAADILDMSRRTPSCIGDETLDMRIYLSPVIHQLAKIVSDVDSNKMESGCISYNLKLITRHAKVVEEYIVI
jgi:hypothetical protein